MSVVGRDTGADLDVAVLVERIGRLEAAEHARNGLATYADAVDARDLDALAAVFAADAVVEVPGRIYTGREEVLGFYADAFTTDPSRKSHFVTNLSTAGLGRGRTSVRCYFLYTAAAEDLSVIGWGQYKAVVRAGTPPASIERLAIAIRRSADVRVGWAETPGSVSQ